MRTTVEPPPVSRCDHCGGQLTLVRVERAYSALGSRSNVYACVNCGQERTFLVQQDNSPAQFAATDRQLRA
jgi:uncharacterized protein with PIN domain